MQPSFRLFWTSRRSILFLCAVLILGLGLRLYRLDSRGIWVDEKMSLGCAQGIRIGVEDLLSDAEQPMKPPAGFTQAWYRSHNTLANVVAGTVYDNGNALAYNVLLHYWVYVWGADDAAIRWLSVLLGLGSVVLGYCIARHIYSDSALAHWAALLLSVHPMLIESSQTARGYSAATFFVLAATYAWLHYTAHEKAILWGILHGILGLIAMLCHYFAGSILLVLAIFALVRYPQYLRNWLLPWSIMAIGMAIWLVLGGLMGYTEMAKQSHIFAQDMPQTTWQSLPFFAARLWVRWSGLGIHHYALGGIAVFFSAGAVFALRKSWQTVLLPAALVAGYLIFVAILAVASGHLMSFLTRYAVLATPFFVILIAATRQRIWLLGLLALMFATLAQRTYHDTIADGTLAPHDREKNPYIQLRESLKQHYQQGDTVIYAHYIDANLANIYLQRAPTLYTQRVDTALHSDDIVLKSANGSLRRLVNMRGKRY